MCRKMMVESIPPLQKADGEWKTSPSSKANILAECFAEKFQVPEVVENVYSHIPEKNGVEHCGFLPIRRREIAQLLKALDIDSAIGPDLVGTRLLKRFSTLLALLITLISRSVICHGIWPSIWKLHWICPLHNKTKSAEPATDAGGTKLL